MRNTNFENLVWNAFIDGEAKASAGRWTARRDGWSVIVTHYSTDMIRVVFDDVPVKTSAWGWQNVTQPVFVEGIDEGYGSSSDRTGIRKITSGAGVSTGYRELFNA
jgi:hypothetical protein